MHTHKLELADKHFQRRVNEKATGSGVKGLGLLRRLRDRHLMAGNQKEVNQLNVVLHARHPDLRQRQKQKNIYGKGKRPEKIVLIPNLRSTDGRR